MTDPAALTLNADCFCRPVHREPIIEKITEQIVSSEIEAMLSERPHYFASTTIFLARSILAQMTKQIQAIEGVTKLPKYIETVKQRAALSDAWPKAQKTDGVFMGYDFHITADGPRLIEINSNAGGAFIVNMIEQAVKGASSEASVRIAEMFQSEWAKAERTVPLKTIAIVDTNPKGQYHYPDMCLAKALLEDHGMRVVIADPMALSLRNGQLYHDQQVIDLVYNRLTDFDLSDPENAVIRQAYLEDAAVVTPAPHHHALHADKRNLILLSDEAKLGEFGAPPSVIQTLQAIPKTIAVEPDVAPMVWPNRQHLFFKPQSGFGSRGAIKGDDLTQTVWRDMLKGGYIAQDLVAPPLRAVAIGEDKRTLKYDVRVYTYDGVPFLYAARIYQGQTTNLRTAGGGLAAVIDVENPSVCMPRRSNTDA